MDAKVETKWWSFTKIVNLMIPEVGVFGIWVGPKWSVIRFVNKRNV